MKDIKKETAKMLAGASKNIAQLVASSAFEFWSRKDYRLYVDFDNLSQTEQDRMFNELEVSVLGLFILHFDQVLITVKDERKMVFSALRKDLAPAFVHLLADSGIEKEFTDQWRTLIDMRLKEYGDDFQTAFKESKKAKELDGSDNLRITWARIETITIDCLTHLRRGEVKEDDPLWKLLRKWLITLDAQLNPFTKMNA
ncbi:MAG TPA: hypothetical protein VLG67_03195 [Candidatus Saccharimonadales bacterium]|nr:hypothetical protein [Candidatus Saccharimonadales bacterium]